MKYKGTILILDNFREVLKDYSLDIQDTVRSAILDGVDLEDYLVTCKENPYRLEQIRLGIKEGLEKDFFRLTSGDLIYRIRDLKKNGVNLAPLLKYCKESLSREYFEYMLSWYKEGFVLDNLNIAVIPKDLLEVFDYGLRRGYPMQLFNKGVNYSQDYIKCCFKILSNNKDVTAFLKGDWKTEVLRLIAAFSHYQVSKYNNLIGHIDNTTDVEHIEKYIECVKAGMPLNEVTKIDKSGKPIYTPKQIDVILQAFVKKLDYKQLYNSKLSVSELEGMLLAMEVDNKRKISGRLYKNRTGNN